MKKIILALTLAAFIGGGTLVFANTQVETEMSIQHQDGKKKTTAKKATKKDECKSEHSKSNKGECSGDNILKKKSCCSDGKTAKTKKTGPEKK